MQEAEEKRRSDGFFTKVYKAVCHAMGTENINKLEALNGDMTEMIKFTYELKCFKDALDIKVRTVTFFFNLLYVFLGVLSGKEAPRVQSQKGLWKQGLPSGQGP